MTYHDSPEKNNGYTNGNSIVSNQVASNSVHRCVLATDIPLTYSESDLYSIFSKYGSIEKIQKSTNLSCCVIEFVELESAISLIQKFKTNPFIIGGKHQIKLDYWTQTIQKSCNIANSDMKVSVQMPSETTSNSCTNNKTTNLVLTDNSTCVLAVQISNAKYPITVDIIKQICQKFGKLERISIERNNDNIVQCLIEFNKVSEAVAAKEALHGEDIYSGCCSLDVKYSKIPKVTVLRNNSESWDFSTSSFPESALQIHNRNEIDKSLATSSNQESLMNSNGTYNFYQNPVSTIPRPTIYPVYNYPPSLYHKPPVGPYPCFPTYDHNFLFRNSGKKKSKLTISKAAFVVEIGVVFTVYNLPLIISVDHLFNLFCLYGNVHKILFLPNQAGVAMVQMGSKIGVDLCIEHYNNRNLFGQDIRLVKSLKPEIFVSKNIEFLANGTPAFKDFSCESNNRFLNDSAVSSYKILEPNRTLHFFNAPYTFVEADLSQMIIQSGVPRPLHIIIFNNKNDQIKKCVGLLEFHRLEDALVALSVLNHKPIIIPVTNQIFHLKLTFSGREPKHAAVAVVGNNSNHGVAATKRFSSTSVVSAVSDTNMCHSISEKRWKPELYNDDGEVMKIDDSIVHSNPAVAAEAQNSSLQHLSTLINDHTPSIIVEPQSHLVPQDQTALPKDNQSTACQSFINFLKPRTSPST